MRQTSLIAYKQINRDLTVNRQIGKIYTFLKDGRGQGYTRNELSRALKMPINAICGRVNELIKLRMIEENGQRRDQYTGKLNYVVNLIIGWGI